jgi:hypothetical protein
LTKGLCHAGEARGDRRRSPPAESYSPQPLTRPHPGLKDHRVDPCGQRWILWTRFPLTGVGYRRKWTSLRGLFSHLLLVRDRDSGGHIEHFARTRRSRRRSRHPERHSAVVAALGTHPGALASPDLGRRVSLWHRSEESGSTWADESRRSVQQCEVQKIQFAILVRDPPLKHHAARAGNSEQIAIPRTALGSDRSGRRYDLLDGSSKVARREVRLSRATGVADGPHVRGVALSTKRIVGDAV